ncbi:MAG: hypothetical protein ACM3N9_00195 [Syntrophothermus sp.]
MKNTVNILLIMLLAGPCITAQEVKVVAVNDITSHNTGVPAPVPPGLQLGQLMGQMAENLKDEAFTGFFRGVKKDFTVAVTTTSDPGGLASALQKLEDGLTPLAMDPGWGAVKFKWREDAATARSIETIADLLRKLQLHITPSFFKNEWQTVKPGWQASFKGLMNE